MKAPSSITCGQCIISWASYVRNVLAAHLPHWRPSATMARRTANPHEREALKSHPHQYNHQQEVHKVSLS